MSPVGFEPTFLVSERPQTHSLDRTATGIGILQELLYYKLFVINGDLILQLTILYWKVI
jgi:hypothetical protein